MMKKSKDNKGGKGKGKKGMDEAEYIQNLEQRIQAEAPPPGTNPLAQDLEVENSADASAQTLQKGGGNKFLVSTDLA
jgi:hypothetical protein